MSILAKEVLWKLIEEKEAFIPSNHALENILYFQRLKSAFVIDSIQIWTKTLSVRQHLFFSKSYVLNIVSIESKQKYRYACLEIQ